MRVHRYDSIPKIVEVGPEIYSVPIPQPFYADNNVYIINSGEPALIDSGYVQSLGILQKALGQLGLSLKKIKHVFYTHEHIDHISAALSLRSYSDAKLYGMAGMADYVGNFVEFVHRFQRAMNRLIYKAHHERDERDFELVRAHEGWQKFLASVDQGNRVDVNMRMDVELVEGDVIRIGDREIGFIHTPGHNRWHLTPYILGEGDLFYRGSRARKRIGDLRGARRQSRGLLRQPGPFDGTADQAANACPRQGTEVSAKSHSFDSKNPGAARTRHHAPPARR